MSLITQCPACHTMFRVVPDQLRISDGWVRCGNCDEVFDGNAHLLPPQAVAVDPDPVPPFAPPVPVSAPEFEPEPEPEPEPATPVVEFPQDDPVLQLRPREHAPSESPAGVVALEDADLGEVVPRVEGLAEDAPRFVQGAPAHVDAEAVAMAELSFMRRTAPPGFWQRKAARRMGALTCVLLLLALGLQVVLQERDRIVAHHPFAEPALEDLCDVFGCTVAPWRQIEALVIDSSAFVKVRADTYRLNAVVRNSAPVAVAVPALELTLTDSQDQPVVRRVLLARELAVSQTRIATGGELTVSVSLSVQTDTSNGTFAGYRLLAFYP